MKSSNGKTISVYNPATDELVTDQVQVASDEDVDKAVAAAKTAFKTWRATPSAERAAIMLKFADLLEANTDKYAQLETINMGMSLLVSRMMTAMQIQSWRYYAGLVDKVPGETYNEDGDGLFKMITYHPLGVCAGISAWNATSLSIGMKVRMLSLSLWTRADPITRFPRLSPWGTRSCTSHRSGSAQLHLPRGSLQGSRLPPGRHQHALRRPIHRRKARVAHGRGQDRLYRLSGRRS